MNILKFTGKCILLLAIIIVITIVIIFVLENTKKVRPKDINADVWEVSLNDLLPKSMVRAMKNSTDKVSIPILIKNQQNVPIPMVTITMFLSDKEVSYYTDASGLFIIKLSSSLLKENAILKIHKEGYKAGDFFYEIGGKTVKFSDEKEDFDVINLTALSTLDQDGIKIYYDKEESDKASTLAIKLREINQKIEQVLGVSGFEPIKILLTSSKNVSTIGDSKMHLLPIDIDNDEDIYWIYVHETVESNLILKKDLYSKNPFLRWIGDGLAEYSSLKIIESTDKELKAKMLGQRIKNIQESKNQNFNLLKWKAITGPVEGYAYSLAFWKNIEKDYGNETIQKFFRKFLNLNDFSLESTARILTELIKNDSKQIFTITKDEALKMLSD